MAVDVDVDGVVGGDDGRKVLDNVVKVVEDDGLLGRDREGAGLVVVLLLGLIQVGGGGFRLGGLRVQWGRRGLSRPGRGFRPWLLVDLDFSFELSWLLNEDSVYLGGLDGYPNELES